MIQKALHELLKGENLTLETTKDVMREMMDGTATQAQMGAFLAALRMKGETVDEITACAEVMRERGLRITPSRKVIDIVGTGGDGTGTFNISTTAALVTAAAEFCRETWEQRSIKQCGAADVLRNWNQHQPKPGRYREDTGSFEYLLHVCSYLSFFYEDAAPVRREMGVRTIFNILGPLSNPAGATMQLMGVYNPKLVKPLARVLLNLGVKRGLCVCGSDGMDEVTLTGETHICEIRDGTLSSYEINPEQFGFQRCSIQELQGGTPKENAIITKNILKGVEKGARRNIVVLNAAMALYLGFDDYSVNDCVKIAEELIDSGKAASKLEELRIMSKGVINQ